MAYCTLAEVKLQLEESKIIELTDDSDTGDIDLNNFNSCVASADRKIDGYCQARYTVPFSAPVPALVTEMSIKLTIVELFARKRQGDKTVKELQQSQEALLAKINKGDIQIGISSTSPIAPQTTAAVRVRTKIFDSDKMDQY